MRPRKLLLHSLCWLVFIVYEISISWYLQDPSTLIDFGAFYVIDILLFYTNAHIVFFYILKNKSFPRLMTLFACIIFELAFYTYLSVCLHNLLKEPPGTPIFSYIKTGVVIMSVWRGVYFLGLSIAYWGVRSTIKAVKATRQAEVSRLEALRQQEKLKGENFQLQNAYLQSRINPHFLLNTLNFIYNQVEESRPEAAESILILSEIMQYSLAGMGEDGKISLKQEIDHIKKYIELNQSRFNHRLYVCTEIPCSKDVDPNARIPPLLLLTFVENLFKHGDLTSKEAPGIVQINAIGSMLSLLIHNRKRKHQPQHRQHLGIANAQTRLKNYYGGELSDLSISQTDSEYNLSLNITL